MCLYPYRRKGRPKGTRRVEAPTDLSAVIDVDALRENHQPAVQSIPRSCLPDACATALPPSARVYSFPDHPGCYLFRHALPAEVQRRVVVDAFTRFPCSPAHTNFNRTHGSSLEGLWEAAQAGLRLAPPQASTSSSGCQEAPILDDSFTKTTDKSLENGENSCEEGNTAVQLGGQPPVRWVSGGDGPTAQHLLRKLRWASVGPVFDWTRRVYRRKDVHLPLPQYLRDVAVALAQAGASIASRDAPCHNIQHTVDHESRPDSTSFNVSSMGPGRSMQVEGVSISTVPPEAASTAPLSIRTRIPPFLPDAALINYYSPGDTLCGHIDDAEVDLNQPLVSLSVGCPAVFLIGGFTTDTPPTAMVLRSGDAVVLHGDARRCYHGVPRIFPAAAGVACEGGKAIATGTAGTPNGNGTSHDKHAHVPQAHRSSDGHGDAMAGAVSIEALSGSGWLDALCDGGGEEFAPFAQHMAACRINVSVRATR